jgi:hypothetical protein
MIFRNLDGGVKIQGLRVHIGSALEIFPPEEAGKGYR